MALGGCASLKKKTCAAGEQFNVHENLSFGTAKPGGQVTVADWDAFLRDVVTPRFPRGLATWESSGQWRGVDGSLVREASHVLVLDHPGDAASEHAVREIISTYKSRFQQEAVFRVKTDACISF